MPVDSIHPQYETSLPKWTRCRDCYDGSDAVKAKREEYLPFIGDPQDTDDRRNYDAYVARAAFYNGTARTIQGMLGSIFRKDTEVKTPAVVDPMLIDITGSGVSLAEFARDCAEEVLITGRVGLLVDMPTVANSRPYISKYRAENIVNWQTVVIDGVSALTMVVLHECAWEYGDDPFKPKSIDQYRVLRLGFPALPEIITESVGISFESGPEIYIVDVWRRKDWNKPGAVEAKDDWEIYSTSIPLMSAEPLEFIPFLFINPQSTTVDCEKPPLLDLVDVNLSHYRNSADLEHGRHWTGCPTPWASGFPISDQDGKPIEYRVGSSKAWVTDKDGAKAEYLEFTGQGLESLKVALEEKQSQMATLGAKLLEPPKKAAEAVLTVQLRHSGQDATLIDITKTLSNGLTHAMKWFCLWVGAATEPMVELNTDLVGRVMDATLLTALVEAAQSNMISWETLYANLQDAELTRVDVSAEDELLAIKADIARMPTPKPVIVPDTTILQ